MADLREYHARNLGHRKPRLVFIEAFPLVWVVVPTLLSPLLIMLLLHLIVRFESLIEVDSQNIVFLE